MLILYEEVNFTTYFFSRDKMIINMNMLVFFLGKCVRTTAKPMVIDRKNQKALALLYVASEPRRNAANSSVVPTEFAAEPTRKSSKANLVT